MLRFLALGLSVLMAVISPGVRFAGGQSTTRANAFPLLHPQGLVFDHSGNLYVADLRANRVYRVSLSGELSAYAGTGAGGYAGDGGPAASALLNAPAGLTVDPAGNLYIADTLNQVIRRVDALSGVISTVAGNGVAGSSPGGLSAVASALHEPTELAIAPSGDLYFSDSRNFRICRVDPVSHLLTVVAGNGTQGAAMDGAFALQTALNSPSSLVLDAKGSLYFSDTPAGRVFRFDPVTGVLRVVAGSGKTGPPEDGGPAPLASLRQPTGLALDRQGNLLIATSSGHAVRRVDQATGLISTIVGTATQGYAGDGGQAKLALLSGPTSLAFSPDGLLTFADTGNQRVRQVDAGGILRTIAGLGGTQGGNLTLAGATTDTYGTGSVTASVGGAAGFGAVNLLDTINGQVTSLGSQPLIGSTSTFSVAQLGAGSHSLTATYAGDALHASAVSSALALTIRPASLSATLQSFSMLYGQPVPTLTGSLEGVLAQDAGKVNLALGTTATSSSAPGTYLVTAALAGPSAGNYVLAASAAAITIAKAPSAITLNASQAAAVVHVASTTSGSPGGAVQLLDGTAVIQTATLSAGGDASFALNTLSNGSHTLSAVYAGDGNFTGGTSVPMLITTGPGTGPDFILAATGQTILNVPGGSPAVYSFSVSPLNGSLSSSVQLSVTGAPSGAAINFNPAYLPPGGTLTAFLMTVQVPQTAKLDPVPSGRWPATFAMLLPLGWLCTRQRRKLPGMMLLVILSLGMLAATGCGDRINVLSGGAGGKAARTYQMTVTGTATSSSGSLIQHSANVTLIVP